MVTALKDPCKNVKEYSKHKTYKTQNNPLWSCGNYAEFVIHYFIHFLLYSNESCRTLSSWAVNLTLIICWITPILSRQKYCYIVIYLLMSIITQKSLTRESINFCQGRDMINHFYEEWFVSSQFSHFPIKQISIKQQKNVTLLKVFLLVVFLFLSSFRYNFFNSVAFNLFPHFFKLRIKNGSRSFLTKKLLTLANQQDNYFWKNSSIIFVINHFIFFKRIVIYPSFRDCKIF